MKYAFAFVLLALFAVIAVSHASEDAATSNDDAGKTTLQVELTQSEVAAIEKIMGGRAFDWKKWLGVAVKVGSVLLG
uniref:Uncharacterized protein n=1 Tax=Anopheles dirus TaxID=7168 RepID=A0A182N9D0_9DIPT